MKRPVPPTAFRTRTPESREDLALIRRYLELYQLWADETYGSSSGAGVTSVTAGTGISVTGTVTAPVVNNTGVTALTTGTPDLVTLSASTGPVQIDVLDTNDPPWIASSRTLSAWDDHFDTGSADLATRGWTVFAVTVAGVFTADTPMVRAGDVAAPVTGYIAANQYRSTIYKSWLYLQFDTTLLGVLIIKPSTGNWTVAARASSHLQQSMPLGWCCASFYPTGPADNMMNRTIRWPFDSANTNTVKMDFRNGTTGSVSTGRVATAAEIVDIAALNVHEGASGRYAYGYGLSSHSGRSVDELNVAPIDNITQTHLGIHVANPFTSFPGVGAPPWWANTVRIDYLRRFAETTTMGPA